MSVSDAQFAVWLEQDTARHCVLVELDYVFDAVSGSTHTPTVATKYVSTLGYTSGPSDTPASTAYDNVVQQVPTFTRELDRRTLGGAGTRSFGELVLANPDGRYDEWLNLACDGSELRFYLGDPTWARSDFRLVFTAITERIDAPDLDSLSVAMRDSLAIVNSSIAQEFIGGTGPNLERAKPVNLGFCHQVECLLEDIAGPKYRYGTESGLVASSVRDRGLAVAYTDNTDGTFNLSASPAGIVTCDVLTRGPAATYQASDLIAKLIDGYTSLDYPTNYAGNITPDTFPGPSSTLFGPGDFELGVRVEEKSNTLEVLNSMCFSAIAFYTFTRDNKFAFGRIWPYIAELVGTSVMSFTADDVRGLPKLTHGDPTYYSWYFYYNKNWHVMAEGDFAGAVTTTTKAQFSAKGVYASNRPSRPGIESVLSPDYYDQPSPFHKTLAVSPETETLLSITDADDALLPDYPLGTRWFRRMRNIFFPWWDFVEIAVGLKAYTLELGSIVTFTLNRWGYDAGVKFQVVSINLRLVDQEIDLVLFRQREADVLPPYVHRGAGLAEGTSTVAGHGYPFGARGLAAGTSTVSGVGTNAAGGGGGTDTYTFDQGGIFTGGYAANKNVEDPDPNNFPAWYQNNAGLLQLNTGLAAGTDIDVIAGADALLLKYPAYFEGVGGLKVFNDASTQFSTGFIDYVSNASPLAKLRFSNIDPGDPLATSSTTLVAPWFQLFDDSDGKVSVELAIQFNQVVGGGGQAFGYLSIIVQNDSASTLTGVANTGADIHILLPSNAANPDAPGTGEWDISFNSDSPPTTFTAGTPYCAINDAGGATLSVSGTRHELQFSITTASITAGSRAHFLFPLVITAGADVPSVGAQGYFIPAVKSTITTTPSESVRVFTDDGSGLIQT
jgi:hypothetical protein